jgi:TonB-dependent receptor
MPGICFFQRCVWLLGLAVAGSAMAGEGARSFDVPAGQAAETLKLAARQGGLEIVFFAETVAGIRTAELRGLFAPREALERLVAGTGLALAADDPAGTLTVCRSDQSVAVSPPPTPTSHSPPVVKSRNPLLLLGAWLALALAPGASLHAADSAQPTGAITGRVKNMITGRYLNKARVVVKQTDLLALTDDSGNYTLPGAPSGAVLIEVFYTGLDLQQVPVTVAAGQTIQQDIALTNAALFGRQDSTVRLDPYVVAATKETDGTAIAINEQRFAPNIKSVVSMENNNDPTNNMGDFLKFVPGVQMQGGTSTSEPETVFVRGFPPNLTVVTADGAPISSTGANGDMRYVELSGVSVNSFSRVEVVKVPTPATGADTMAGSINLISKKAFERPRAEIRYQVSLVGNSRNLSFRKEAFPDETFLRPITPSFSVDYTLPLNNRFGLVLSAAHSDYFITGNWVSRNWATSGAGTGATNSKPFFSSIELREDKRHLLKDTVSAKADWRITPHSVLSFGTTVMYTTTIQRITALTVSAGTNGNSTPAGGVPFSYTGDSVVGATGRGSVTLSRAGGAINISRATSGGNLRYAFDNGEWKIDAIASMSAARFWYRNLANNTFDTLTTAMKFPVRVTFTNIGEYGPGKTQVFNNANQEIDPYDPANYNLTAVAGREVDSSDERRNANLDIKRRIEFLPFPFTVQAGAAQGKQSRDKSASDPRFTYQGPNGDQSAARFLNEVYNDRRFAHNNVDRAIPMFSSKRAFQAWQANPALFVMTPAQKVAAEIARVNFRESITEDVSALYFQTEARFFNNRLNLLTGVRYEKTTDNGRGPLQDVSAVWQRNANGTFVNNAAGARIRRPEAGAVGSMEEALLVYHERGYRGKRSYDGSYPSLHLTYNVSDHFLVRGAYAKTYGRPNFRDVIPNASVNENDDDDPSGIEGTITVRNTGLRPWNAHNFDLSLEYYTNQGGLFGASVFYKDISGFFGTLAKVATPADLVLLGLGSEYVGWQVNSTINAGDATVAGVELSANHSLRPLGGWGQYFSAFANFTKLEMKGPQSSNFTGFLPLSINGGITFNRKPVIFTAKWNHRADQRTGPYAAFGPEAYYYYPARTHLDLDCSYQLRANLSLFANARNVLNVPSGYNREAVDVPGYAKKYQTVEYGVSLALGIKGSF